MGMFDYVKVHHKYLADDEKEEGWQTKDLDRHLDTIEITKEGTIILFKDRWDNEKLERCEDYNSYTGKINFYQSVGNYNTPGSWREYRADFIDGKLIKIEVIS
jgi:hypothetical protein